MLKGLMTVKRGLSDEDWGYRKREEPDQLPAQVPVPDLPLMRPGFEETVKEYARHTHSKNTGKSYASDWAVFDDWCMVHKVPSLPAASSTIAAFLIDLADLGFPERASLPHRKGKKPDSGPRKVSTLIRYLAAISVVHKKERHPSPWKDPKVREVLDSIKRKKGEAPTKAKPLLSEHLKAISANMSRHQAEEGSRLWLEALRDLAILLIAFAGAFRRSELSGINVKHLTFGRTTYGRDEVRVFIPFSKTDPFGRGETVAIPASKDPSTCPVQALRTWLSAAKITEGAVFRGIHWRGKKLEGPITARLVGTIVKKRIAEIGIDPEGFGGHSPRAGLATEAARKNKRLDKVMLQTRHKHLPTLMGYIRDAEISDEDNAAAGLLD